MVWLGCLMKYSTEKNPQNYLIFQNISTYIAIKHKTIKYRDKETHNLFSYSFSVGFTIYIIKDHKKLLLLS